MEPGSVSKYILQDVANINDPANYLNFPRGSRLSERQILSLLQPIQESEIRRTIFSMDPYKAPGGDGLPAKFYQANWEVVGKSVCNFVENAFREGCVDQKTNETLLCIIPKIENPERINQFRPISLCNVIIKAITKLIVNRLRPFLTNLVSPTQSSFIPGRSCHDNIIVVQEAIHSFNKCRGKNGYFLMKVDLEKAYDRINWDFLRWVLMDVGLPSNWISLIMFCVTKTEFSLLWNGEKLDPFIPAQGVRQGDPLSPYLFAICLERLSQIIENAVDKKNWTPFKFGRNGPKISHIFFADDLVLFGEATEENITNVMDCLDAFCSFSGQRVNSSKSKIFFSSNTSPNKVSNVCRIAKMEKTDDLGKYLGVELHTKRVSKATFHGLINKMQNKLSQWKAAHLSLAGRQVLVQAVTSTIHTQPCHAKRSNPGWSVRFAGPNSEEFLVGRRCSASENSPG